MELEAENSRSMYKVNKCKDTAAVKLILKRDVKESANQLSAMLQTADLENQYLRRDIQKWPTMAEDVRVGTADSHYIVYEAALVLEKLKSSLLLFRTCWNLAFMLSR
jgi:hypothetical protein